jgi:hypothetical protein
MATDTTGRANVISLEPRKMEGHFKAVNEVEGYWTALTGLAGGVPARAQVDPRGIEGALHQAFVLERIAPGVARFRLAGIHLSDLMGMEIRGMPLTALFLPEARPAANAALDRAFDGPAKVTITLNGERGIGRGPLEARMILLPLVDESGRVTRLLGALEAKGEIGRQPRRFAVSEVHMTNIEGQPMTEPVHLDTPAPKHAASGFSEPEGPEFSTARRPYLRLVKTGD